MKERTRNTFRRLADITGKKCAGCPATDTYRCCDKMFCQLNIMYLNAKKLPIPEQPGVGGIPFMGNTGCVVPPEYRPYCTAYVCPPHFQADRDFKREYDRLIARFAQDKDAPPMEKIVSGILKDRQAKIDPLMVDLVRKPKR
jgi:hypothetical protein